MFIYKIRNIINNKIYVGKTIQSVDTRCKRHVLDSKNGSNYAFHQALRKYGVENFTIEIIDLTGRVTEKELNEVEQYHVLMENSYIDNHGYNMTLGGDTGNAKPIKQYNLETLEVIKIWDSQSEASQALNIDSTSISGCCTKQNKIQNNSSAGGYGWCFLNDDPIPYISNRDSAKKGVKQYNLKTLEIIKIWPSIASASEELNIQPSTISGVCRKERKSAGDFGWCFEEDNPIEYINNSEANIIKQYNLDTLQIIKIWPSMGEASRQLGIRINNISNCCHKRLKSADGFGWCFANEEPKKYEHGKIKEVIQYNLNNDIIKIWKSIAEASKSLNIESTAISKVCRKKRRTAGGYGWSFNSHSYIEVVS
jgi:hypothetical protein